MNRASLVHEKNEADNDRIFSELSYARYHAGSIRSSFAKNKTNLALFAHLCYNTFNVTKDSDGRKS
ncbi:hypothetical protein EYC58_04745 [Candidatus Saccharibacteria bacterium]|nr:MAG: hypothetical protein EYC58_04745 [Candidatus Saccharibacteria bacterium]